MSYADETSDSQEPEIYPPDPTVGYRRPPKRTRFKSGQSGNLRGRPRGSRGLKNVVAEVLAEPVTIREGEKTRRVSLLKAMVKSNSLKKSWRTATLTQRHARHSPLRIRTSSVNI
jgi:hypothetical protein